MKILGVIPSRYASRRFPGKSLTDIAGKSMVQRVTEQAQQSSLITDVVVATDDRRIYDHVSGFGGKAWMTDTTHQSGTDRCCEALQLQSASYNYVVNIQGDEPFIRPDEIDLLGKLLDGNTQIATLIIPIGDPQQIFDPNVVKVVMGLNENALYFSRSPMPYCRSKPQSEWSDHHTYYKHAGIYAYRTDILERITQLPVSILEKAESLEQLRWIENGYEIKTAITHHQSIGIDTPQDLEKALKTMKRL